MFKRLADTGCGRRPDRRRQARRRTRSGDTVAAALLAAGIDRCRTTPVTRRAALPYCLMGVCFDCLVTIDGVGSRQGCLGAGARGHEGRDATRQARGRTMTSVGRA